MNDQPEVHDNPARQRFETAANDSLAIAEYRISVDTVTFTHTVVPPALRGHGLGTHLVEAALASARERRLKVIPECSMFAAYMRDHSATHDLLAPEGRALIGL